ncbi:MAG TPA: hypothetical protein PLV92_30385, partial [Pirellulaceae bacterium]|nr:hypothetical protein [Pirellulaceae bacterium]
MDDDALEHAQAARDAAGNRPSESRGSFDDFARLTHEPAGDAQESLVRFLQRFELRFAARRPPTDLLDLVQTSRDTSAHVAKGVGNGQPCCPNPLHFPARYARDVFAEPAVERVSNACLNHRGVDAHAPTSRDLPSLGLADDALEHPAERRFVDRLVDADHRLRIGDLAAVDATERAIRDVASDLPFQLFKAPLPDVLESQQSQSDLRRSARPAAA